MSAQYLPVNRDSFDTCALDESALNGGYTRPHTGEYVAPHEDEWTWRRVQEMVDETKGFYVRDWPLQLGWNNVSIALFP